MSVKTSVNKFVSVSIFPQAPAPAGLKMLSSKFSEAVYTSGNIKFRSDKVVATAAISRGELLFVEHVFHAPEAEDIYQMLANSRDMYEAAQPKNLQWIDKMTSSSDDVQRLFTYVSRKCQKSCVMTVNATDTEELICVLKGEKSAVFNSSPNFNIKTRIIQVKGGWSRHQTTDLVTFISVNACRDIKAGEELLTYAPMNNEVDMKCYAKFMEPVFEMPRDKELCEKSTELCIAAIKDYVHTNPAAAEILVNTNMARRYVFASRGELFFLRQGVNLQDDFAAKADSHMQKLLKDVQGPKTVMITSMF